MTFFLPGQKRSTGVHGDSRVARHRLYTHKSVIVMILIINGLWGLLFCMFYYYRSIRSNNILYYTRTWHGGNPFQERAGTCWCNFNNRVLSSGSQRWDNGGEYCMCTPNLAIDIVLASETDPSYVWLVQRKDTNQYAVLGGFVEVGESVEQAVYREVWEETGYRLTESIHLLGIYSDAKRDSRRHTVSVVYYAFISDHMGQTLKPADDVKQVVKMSLSQALQQNLFSDHVTILSDFIIMALSSIKDHEIPAHVQENNRSLCSSF